MDQCCKVRKIVEGYDLQHGVDGVTYEEYLLDRWRGDGEYTATGLRPLADSLNKKVLKTVYNRRGRNTLGNRVEADYEALTDGEDDRAVVDDLDADGIDAGQLRSDFVSATTLYRHFTDCLGASKSADTDDGSTPTDWEVEKVAYARDLVRRNVGESLTSLANKDRLPGARDAEIKTEIVLGCPVCATQVSFLRALDRGYVCADHLGRAPDRPADDTAASSDTG